jgi:predicted permease
MTSVNSLAYAWRSLRRAPVFTAAVILTLTIGIGAATTIFTVVDAVLLRPLPYAEPDRLVGAWHDMPALSMKHVEQTEGTYFTYKRFAHSLQDIAEYDHGSVSVIDPDGRAEPQRMDVAWTTANLFSVLGVSSLLGRTYTTAEDAPKGPNVVVLSEGLWRSRFAADHRVIGKKLVVSGTPYEIIGVMPERFRFPDAGVKLWMPRQLDSNAVYPGGFSHDAVARLRPGVSIAAAERDLASVLPRMLDLFPNVAPGVTTKMLLDQARPVPRLIPLREDIVGDVARTLWIVAATAALVLLVTCANVANLMLVRADGRYRELSVRAALGAGRGNVLVQFFTESVVLAAASATLALGASWLGVRALVSAGPAEIPRLSEVSIGGTTVVFTIVTALFVAAACSIIPAVRFLRSDALAGLREGGRSGTVGGARQRARSLLVAAQMAFALVVLAASGLLFRSFQRLHAVKPGFNPDGVATFWVSAPAARYPNDSAVVRFYATLTSRLAVLPGVKSIGITSHLPLIDRGADHDPFYVEGDATYAKSIPPLQTYATVDGGYFEAMGIPLVAGRTFNRIDSPNGGDEAVISVETAKQFFHDSTGRRALNKRYQSLPNAPYRTIVGVVGGVRDSTLSAPATATVYLPETVGHDTLVGGVAHTMAIVIRTAGDGSAVTRAAQRVVREMDPTLPTFDVRSMRAVMEGSIARLSFTMIILGVAAAVTLLLGIIGLYGVIAYIVTLRTREIGVRIALGAQPRSVMTMVTAQGLTLSALGIVAGVALALLVARFLRALLFEVAPSDPLTLSAASAVLVVMALVASWIPARRAAHIDPTEALRAE